MCTGIEIVGLIGGALGALGQLTTGLSAQRSAEKQAAARNKALSGFLDKNEALAQEARSRFDQRLAQEGDPSEQQKPLERKREDQALSLIDKASAASPIPLGGNAPQVVAAEAAKAQSEAGARSREDAKNLAATRAFGDLLFQKGLQTESAQRDIGIPNAFAQANARLLPIQQDLAQQRAASKGGGLLGTIGPIAGALGSLGVQAAGSGGFGSVIGTPKRIPQVPQFSPGTLF